MIPPCTFRPCASSAIFDSGRNSEPFDGTMIRPLRSMMSSLPATGDAAATRQTSDPTMSAWSFDAAAEYTSAPGSLSATSRTNANRAASVDLPAFRGRQTNAERNTRSPLDRYRQPKIGATIQTSCQPSNTNGCPAHSPLLCGRLRRTLTTRATSSASNTTFRPFGRGDTQRGGAVSQPETSRPSASRRSIGTGALDRETLRRGAAVIAGTSRRQPSPIRRRQPKRLRGHSQPSPNLR